MSYSTEHQRLKPVLDTARQFDVADNPAPEAIFETGAAGFQIWCTPEDHPQGWNDVPMDAGAFCKPCAYVASVHWGWEEESITHLVLSTDAYALREHTQMYTIVLKISPGQSGKFAGFLPRLACPCSLSGSKAKNQNIFKMIAGRADHSSPGFDSTPKEFPMFEPIPEPAIDLDLDIPIAVKEILEHPLVENLYPAGLPWIVDEVDIVHIYLKGGTIRINGKLYTSATSTTPIPRYKPDFLLGEDGITYFRGVIHHPWEDRKRCRHFQQKYLQAGVDHALVTYIHESILDNLDTLLDEAREERLWLQIASAALQRQCPTENWFIPWLASAEVKQAAIRAFEAFDWIEIVNRGYDLWVTEQNLAQYLRPRSLPPEMAGVVAADSPFGLY